MNTQPATDGMDKIEVKAALERCGWSLSRLSKAHGYARCVASLTFLKPWPQMEWIIAETIGKKPWEIWPHRYPNGPTPRPERRGKTQNVNSTTGEAA
jgi:lambda repressor-like predicted transcriptional regulator